MPEGRWGFNNSHTKPPPVAALLVPLSGGQLFVRKEFFPTVAMLLVLFFSFDEGSGRNSEFFDDFFSFGFLVAILLCYLLNECRTVGASDSLRGEGGVTGMAEVSLRGIFSLTVFDCTVAFAFEAGCFHFLFLWVNVLQVLFYFCWCGMQGEI